MIRYDLGHGDVVMTVQLDQFPVTVRGPLSTNRSKLVTFARLFVHNGRLYVAESRDKGYTVAAVSSYDLPEGEPVRRGSKNATWGPWSWSGCGCSSRWRSQNIDHLVTLEAGVGAS